jgi:hypothetical protein
MSDNVQFPIARMSEKARIMQEETSSLASEISSHLQQIQHHHSNLPSSMQPRLEDFILSIKQHLSNGLHVRTQIGKHLGEAANSAQDNDTDITSDFKGFTD